MKHFIDINNFTYAELRKILKKAKDIKNNKEKNISILKDKSLGLIFQKQSTRTRVSFALGMQNLGGKVIELDSNQIGFGKRETEEDILKTLSLYLDVIMIRNDDHKQITNLASKNILPIINGLSNISHPCQILSDVFTIEEKFGSINKLTIAWLGDYNNVLISLIQASEIFKFKLNILVPKILQKNHKSFFPNKKLMFCKFYNSVDEGMKNVDCVMTDTWISMGEKKSIRKKKLLSNFQINSNLMNKAKKNAIFMHCLPANRGEEVTNKIIDGNQSVVWDQAKNRMYVQQSILHYLISDD